MNDTERELKALRAEVDGMREREQHLIAAMRRRQRRVLTLLGTLTVCAAVGIVLTSRPALSDPAVPFACGHGASLYCFNANAAALASEVNSNFEAAFQELDKKLNLTGGTLTGNLTVPNLTINGSVSLGLYTRTSNGGGGGATAFCQGSDLVVGGNAACSSGAALVAGGSTMSGTQSGYYGTCSGGALVNVVAYCLSKARP